MYISVFVIDLTVFKKNAACSYTTQMSRKAELLLLITDPIRSELTGLINPRFHLINHSYGLSR